MVRRAVEHQAQHGQIEVLKNKINELEGEVVEMKSKAQMPFAPGGRAAMAGQRWQGRPLPETTIRASLAQSLCELVRPCVF